MDTASVVRTHGCSVTTNIGARRVFSTRVEYHSSIVPDGLVLYTFFLYTCTMKQKDLEQNAHTNVTGHRTPVCPNDTSKNRSSVGKLKAEAVLEHEPIAISYHDNGEVASEAWESGKGPDGLESRKYHDNGKIASEHWESGKGPDGLECRKSYEDGNIIDEYLPIWHNRRMNLYPCTKNPPCTNVSGHRTPVCPNDTSKTRSSVSKLKTEAMLEHEPIAISYHENGKVYREEWPSGKGPDGLFAREYHKNGKVSYEEWEDGREPGKGPDGLLYRSYHENGKLYYEEWEPGKGPDGLSYRRFYENGKVLCEHWESGKGPDGLRSYEYHENGKVLCEHWEPGKGPDGLFIRRSYRNGKVAFEKWEPGKGPEGLWYREFYRNGKVAFEKWEPGKGPGGIKNHSYDDKGRLISTEYWE